MEQAIQRIKKHTPGFRIIGLKAAEARKEIMRTYIELRTEIIAKLVGAKPLEDRIAIAAYIIVAWYSKQR
jgi:hypothetical protein